MSGAVLAVLLGERLARRGGTVEAEAVDTDPVDAAAEGAQAWEDYAATRSAELWAMAERLELSSRALELIKKKWNWDIGEESRLWDAALAAANVRRLIGERVAERASSSPDFNPGPLEIVARDFDAQCEDLILCFISCGVRAPAVPSLVALYGDDADWIDGAINAGLPGTFAIEAMEAGLGAGQVWPAWNCSREHYCEPEDVLRAAHATAFLLGLRPER